MKRLQFKGFWNTFKKKDNYFTRLLSKYGYKFEVVENDPDIIIFSVFGNYSNYISQHLVIDNIHKIFYTAENSPIMENANLNLTFRENTNNNIRFPLWVRCSFDNNMILTPKTNAEFCCFVYSNQTEFRNKLCNTISNYKKVDCGGKCLNNIGGLVPRRSKIDFQKKYKFCIACENSIEPGYTTEKILDAYKSNCIPIYYGSDTITDDFNPETFINVHNFDNKDDLIEYLKKVDTYDSLYNSFMNKPVFSKKWLDIFNDKEDTYFKNIAKRIIG